MADWTRADGRALNELRKISLHRAWQEVGEGSVLVEFGKTRVLCVASFEEGVPRWRKDSGKGWVTAEYAMLPRATSTRNDRESVRGKIGGRTHEISRLIGRALRAVVDYQALGENTIHIDCDVLQADGGTRTASITGAFVALVDAVNYGVAQGLVHPRAGKSVLSDFVSAVSVGMIDGHPCLDLPYVEDSRAESDVNVVMTGSGRFIEVQGTAEGEPFSRDELGTLLDFATEGTAALCRIQRAALEGVELGRGVLNRDAWEALA